MTKTYSYLSNYLIKKIIMIRMYLLNNYTLLKTRNCHSKNFLFLLNMYKYHI